MTSFSGNNCFLTKTWTWLIDADKIKVHGLKRLSNIQFLSELDLKLHKTGLCIASMDSNNSLVQSAT